MTEFLDVLDGKGEKTGEILPRDEVHEKSLWHLSVNLWVVTPDHKILLHRRSKNKKAFPGCWAHAAAGHVSSGKSSMEAIIEEAKEEIGLELKPQDIEFLFSFPKEETVGPDKHLHVSHFDTYLTCREIDIDKIEIQPEEVEKVKLFTLGELETMVTIPGAMLPFPYEYPKIIKILKKRFSE